MFKFDDNGELIQESVTESAMFDSEEIELDDEDNILLFEALLLDVMTEEEYKAYTESSEYIEDLKSIYNIDINKARPVIEAMKTKVKLNVFDEIRDLLR